MHEAVGQKDFFHAHVNEIVSHLGTSSPDVLAHISSAYGLTDPLIAETKRVELAAYFGAAAAAIATEDPQPYSHYVLDSQLSVPSNRH